MINKPSIFVTSTGRTGTTFFARLYEKIIAGCDAFHTPGLIPPHNPLHLLEQLRHFSARHLVLDKLIPSQNLRGMSILRIAGKARIERAAATLERLRKRFVNNLSGELYVESNQQLLGLIDVIPHVFKTYRTVLIIRDPREWVTSSYRCDGGSYGLADPISFLKYGRLSAPLCRHDPWAAKWETMSKFQKLCWLWNKKNQYALSATNNTPQTRLVLFDSLFRAKDKYLNLKELIDFTVDFGSANRFEYQSLDGILDHKKNQSTPAGYPDWVDWEPEQAWQMQQICGSLMDELGYAQEPEWQEMCRKGRVTTSTTPP